MDGKIIKGIGGFYYVQTKECGLFECRAKGIFRKEGKKPMVGDEVVIDILDETNKTGNLVQIKKRKNELIRPMVSNVDQALIVFAIAKPQPNLNLLDRFLISMKKQNVPTLICFNKVDIVSDEEINLLKDTYLHCGYEVVFTSVHEETGLEQIRNLIDGKTTVLAGPSGVGKSSMINFLYPEAQMQTGEVSKKIERGRHTTRHSEFFYMGNDTYLLDTPGFSSLYLDLFEENEIKDYFDEFMEYEPYCKFNGCLHISEPVCGVKQAVQDGKISKIRYENYCQLYNECKERRKW